MAKVSLRIYNREIERLVEQGQTDEAIAHCRHILKTFPKHLETYRLLGKAYLEARRYGEAVEIFGRLLMAVPDDFVAHVGLSIIRDEENKLDDAIWHMERAFEVQSSNAAIQGELQRLYGRRDGMEPPKVRMTRGALARIYVLGELYPQAIAEIRGVLAEDSQRVDMQSLLAYSYYKSSQRADATDICNQLLKRYAYSLDANRILVELLPGTAGAVESTQVYRMRVAEMDPYSNFTKGSIFLTGEVPDASINLERLEYSGEEVQLGQEWKESSLGFSSVPPLGDGTSFGDGQPEWLRSSTTEETPQSSAMPDSAAQASEGIPDFLRAAGWGESKTPETPASIFDEEPTESNLVQADIPEWLQSQAPPAQTGSAEPPAASVETPDYLTGLDASFDPFAGASAPGDGSLPDWLAGSKDIEATPPSFESSPAQPLSPAEDAGNVPDWLRGLGDSAPMEPTPDPNAPDWLAGLGGMAAVTAVSQPEEPAEPVNIPDWLSASEPRAEATAASVENLGASSQEQDDAVAWLESLAAKHGAKPEELVTDPNKRSDTPPEWVAQAQNIGAGAPAEQKTPPPTVENLGSSAQEQDDAVAWLESLAAKHGAKPEELVTDPNKRSDTPPEWVAQAQHIGAQAPAESEPIKPEWSETAASVGEEFFAEFEKASTFQPEADETGIWLRGLDEGKPPADEQPLERGSIPEWLSEPEPAAVEKPRTSLDTASLPDWLGGLDTPTPEETAGAPEDTLVKNQDLSDWLSGLDDEPGLDIDPETLRAPLPPLETKRPVIESEPEPAADLPEWMNDLDAESKAEPDDWMPPAKTMTPAAAQPASVSLSADLPDWLQGVDETEAEQDQDDLPPWEHREKWEAEGAVPSKPKPTSPSDWHPVSAESSLKDQPPRGQGQRLVQNPPAPEPVEKMEKKKMPAKQGLPRAKKSEAQGSVNALSLAKSELDRGDIPEALMHYGKLIKKGKHLEEVIGNLSESLYRYPVEVSIWQALGDAYMRANRLKEALEAYNKAEELIR